MESTAHQSLQQTRSGKCHAPGQRKTNQGKKRQEAEASGLTQTISIGIVRRVGNYYLSIEPVKR
jgi:hypothetical protein